MFGDIAGGRARPTEVTPHAEPVIGRFEPQPFFYWFDICDLCAGILKYSPKAYS